MNPSTKTVAIILNGPPECGKDTLARYIAKNFQIDGKDIHIHQFKDALYEHTARHFGVDVEAFTKAATNRDTKDNHSFAGLGGRTPREALIHVSEDIYKPRYGKDYFGHVEAEKFSEHRNRAAPDTSFFAAYPDGGFPDEVCVHPADLVIVVRLHKYGCDFSKDSRDYVYLPDTLRRTSFDLDVHEGMVKEDALALIAKIKLAISYNALGGISMTRTQTENTETNMLPVTTVKTTHPEAKIPAYMTAGAAAADVTCVRWTEKFEKENTVWNEGRAIVNPGKAIIFDTGLSFEVPIGHELKVYSRSGHGFNAGIRLSNAVGILDSDYRGNLLVRLHNDSDTAFILEMGERICQVQVKPAPQNPFVLAEQLSETTRGEGGFGHTGS